MKALITDAGDRFEIDLLRRRLRPGDRYSGQDQDEEAGESRGALHDWSFREELEGDYTIRFGLRALLRGLADWFVALFVRVD